MRVKLAVIAVLLATGLGISVQPAAADPIPNVLACGTQGGMFPPGVVYVVAGYCQPTDIPEGTPWLHQWNSGGVPCYTLYNGTTGQSGNEAVCLGIFPPSVSIPNILQCGAWGGNFIPGVLYLVVGYCQPTDIPAGAPWLHQWSSGGVPCYTLYNGTTGQSGNEAVCLKTLVPAP